MNTTFPDRPSSQVESEAFSDEVERADVISRGEDLDDPIFDLECVETTRAISLVRSDVKRARASVVISVYENENWIGRQLHSLFTQWRSDIDLIIIDDGSSDRSLEVARAAIATRPDISATILRNGMRSGLSVIPQVLEFTSSQIIIQADSDDITLPGRLDAIIARFDADPLCRLVTSNAIRISTEDIPLGLEDVEHDDGIINDPLDVFARRWDVRWLGATSAFHRSLIEDFPLDTELCPYGLDLLLAPRASLVGTHHYISEPMIGWRQHPRNTHRLEGALSTNAAARERYLSLELMALAQRIRDIGHFEAREPRVEGLGRVLVAANILFLDIFTEWSRIRNSLPSMPSSETGKSVSIIPVPPIVTVLPNKRRYFGRNDALGVSASHWSGVWPPEAEFNWAGRRAMLAVRAPGARTIRIHLASAPSGGEQTVRLKAGGGAWQVVQVSGEAIWVTLDAEGSSELVVIRIEAPNAARPCDLDPNSTDERRLGVYLLSLEAT